MSILPSDRAVLQCIYDMYLESYPGKKGAGGKAENDPYISIDVKALAENLDCTPELLFGRLYYHLDKKYRYRQDDGSLVPLFYLQVDDKRHAVNFPYLASVLAGENRDFLRFVLPVALSAVALIVSVASVLIGIYLKI